MAAPLQTLPAAGTITEGTDIVYLQQPSKSTKDTKATLSQILAAPYAAVAAEATARAAADATLTTNLANEITRSTNAEGVLRYDLSVQQALESNFTNLQSIFEAPSVVATNLAGIQGQYRAVSTRRADGSYLGATASFHWAPASAAASGWTFSSGVVSSGIGALGAAFVAFLESTWEISAGATWPHRTLFGHLFLLTGVLPLVVFQDDAGVKSFKIIGTVPSTLQVAGEARLYVPGV